MLLSYATVDFHLFYMAEILPIQRKTLSNQSTLQNLVTSIVRNDQSRIQITFPFRLAYTSSIILYFH